MENIQNEKSSQDKYERLLAYMDKQGEKDVAIAFSGGVDSTLLLSLALEAARKYGTKVYAFTIHTTLHPVREIEFSRKIATELGAIHKTISVNELTDAGIIDNPENRCYLCKKYMFERLINEANEQGITAILDGTNADDEKEYRPGLRALQELGILSPLKLMQFTKKEVRNLAAKRNITVANKPATPCMATRFPYHTRLTEEKLEKADKMETFIRNFGFYNVRVRVHENLIRIEVDTKDIEKLCHHKEKILNMAKTLGYDYITVDLEGFRSGSQDIHIAK